MVVVVAGATVVVVAAAVVVVFVSLDEEVHDAASNTDVMMTSGVLVRFIQSRYQV